MGGEIRMAVEGTKSKTKNKEEVQQVGGWEAKLVKIMTDLIIH